LKDVSSVGFHKFLVLVINNFSVIIIQFSIVLNGLKVQINSAQWQIRRKAGRPGFNCIIYNSALKGQIMLDFQPANHQIIIFPRRFRQLTDEVSCPFRTFVTISTQPLSSK
jgi:hypothetical protein